MHDKFTSNDARMPQKSKSKKPKPKPKLKTKSVVRSIDQKRLDKLLEIKARLEQGQHVQNRTLQTWLTADEFAQIDYRWASEKERRESMYGEKPAAIVTYEERFQKIIFLNNRADGYEAKGKREAAKKLRVQVEGGLESLLEWLSESYSEDSSLMAWFDRDISNALEINEALDLDAMPRVITTRSALRQRTTSTQSIASIKLQVVSAVIDSINRPVSSNQAATSARLKKLIDIDAEPDF